MNDLYVGVPVKLGADGVEQIIEFELTKQEQSQLENSAQAVEELIEVMKNAS